MSAEFLTCRELVELITEYLEGALAPDRRSAFEAHVAICPPCRNYLDEIRRTVGAAASLTEDSIPDDTREAMLEVFRHWREEI